MKRLLLGVFLFSGLAYGDCGTKPFLGIDPGYQYAHRGETVHVRVILNNKDSVECGYSVFHVEAKDLDEGADAYFPIPDVLVYPGGSSDAFLTVSVGQDADLGQHLIRVDASRGGFSHAVVHVK